MANNIKGITIEIGGDTSKLDSALKGIDSKTRSLSQELKQINNQLKFDPHNAVLLKQKFDVLSDQVEKTREKLKTLEEAQEQVERQFQNGEIDEGQYRAFQREIEKTKSQLDYFEKEAEDAKHDLDNLGNEADQTGGDFKDLGRDAQNSAKQVGSGFNTTAINMSAVMNVVSQIGNLIQSAIQGAVRLGQKIAGIINDYLATADEIATNSKKFGISTDTYQKWKYASEIIDVSAETIGSSLGKLTKQMGKDNEAFETLGVSVYDASGKYRDAEDVFYDVVDALGKIDDETQADIISNQLFGKSFQELEPLIDAGADSLKDLGIEAENRHAIMTPEELEAMNQAKDALDKIKYQLGVALAPVIEAISPYIEKIATWLGEKLADPHVQEVIQKLADAFGQMAEAIADSLIDLVESGAIEDLIDALIDFIPVLTDFIKDSLPVLIEALKQIMGFITGMATSTDDFNKKLEDCGNGIDEFATEGEITAGLMKKAFNGAFSGKGGIGWTIADTLDKAGIDHKEFFEYCEGEGGLGGFVGKWSVAMHDVTTALGERFSEMWTNVSNWFQDVGRWFSELPGKIGNWFSSIPGKISSVFNTAWEHIKEWFEKIGEWFRDLPNKIWNWIKSIPEKIKKAFSGQATVSASGQIGYRGGYAEGGIFKKSSFVNIGEAGPEVVLPLDRLGQVLSSVGYSGGGIVVNAPVQVVKELNDAELNRVGGRLTDIVGRQFAKRTGGVL